MNEEEISKKDLLELTGISYGQLYRWKRKNLIPEEWFIRKSSFTGQETFFPKQKILQRIDRIINMKDGLSLDELADVFSPSSGEISITPGELLQRNIVTNMTLDLFEQELGKQDVLTFADILSVYVLEKLLRSGEITRDEGKMLLSLMRDHYAMVATRPCELALVRKMGVPLLLLIETTEHVYVDRDAKWVFRLPLRGCIEELKLKINQSEV